MREGRGRSGLDGEMSHNLKEVKGIVGIRPPEEAAHEGETDGWQV